MPAGGVSSGLTPCSRSLRCLLPLSTSPPQLSKKASFGAAVLAALAASSCCLGPLVLGALGLGGAASFAAFAAYRPVLLAVTAGSLLFGFYLAYRKPKAGPQACGCEQPARRRGPRAL